MLFQVCFYDYIYLNGNYSVDVMDIKLTGSHTFEIGFNVSGTSDDDSISILFTK
ncbi:MAG: hypothetical protein K6E10_02720 [Eubacterium sp.]|nr:hypothetical protein [Eubacterium sp.]